MQSSGFFFLAVLLVLVFFNETESLNVYTVEGDGSRSGSFPASLKHVSMVGPEKK